MTVRGYTHEAVYGSSSSHKQLERSRRRGSKHGKRKRKRAWFKPAAYLGRTSKGKFSPAGGAGDCHAIRLAVSRLLQGFQRSETASAAAKRRTRKNEASIRTCVSRSPRWYRRKAPAGSAKRAALARLWPELPCMCSCRFRFCTGVLRIRFCFVKPSIRVHSGHHSGTIRDAFKAFGSHRDPNGPEWTRMG